MKVTVTNASSVKVAGSSIRQRVLCKNLTGTATVYVEIDQAAADATGYEWEGTDAPLSLQLDEGQSLNMRVASAGADQDIRVLRGAN